MPLAFDRWNTDVALQMTLINWQTLGFTGIVTRVAHKTIGRARPKTYGCSDEPDSSFPCPNAGPGFFSGHVSLTSASAALSCVHNAALPLYGDNVAGVVTCGALSASTVTVGVMRIVVDKHWFSDVLVGHLVGAGVGITFPWLLHYQHRITPNLTLGIVGPVFVPWANTDSYGLSLLALQ